MRGDEGVLKTWPIDRKLFGVSVSVCALLICSISFVAARAHADEWPKGWYPEPAAPPEPRLMKAGGYADLSRLPVPYWWDTAEPLTILSVAAVRFYQTRLSRHRRAECPLVPSCSRYGLMALSRHGWLKGWWLTLSRLLFRENANMHRHRPHVQTRRGPKIYDPIWFSDLSTPLKLPLVPRDVEAVDAAVRSRKNTQ